MSIVQPVSGNRETLRRMTRFTTNGDSLVIRLFKDHKSGIVKGDSVRSFLYPTGTGYAQQTLNPANWTYGADSIFYPTVSFAFSGADSINGYMVVSTKMPGDSVVMWAETFTAPYIMGSPGGTVQVAPIIGVN